MSEEIQEPDVATIVASVRAEMRPGGRPAAKYFDELVVLFLPHKDGVMLTNEIVRNLEDRLCALEEEAELA